MSRERCKTIGVDCDGTLCKESCWSPEEVLKATPKKEVIEKVNKLAESNFIVIYTARREELITATLRWLRENGVRFHAISINKTPCDFYLDDHAIHPDDLHKKDLNG